ncbi:MAG TPA: hypothetical protein VF719_06640, partial [Abditibacteriaceae bacterium]
MVALGADDKKKIYVLLGLAGLLGVVLVIVKPFGGGSGSGGTTVPAASNTTAAETGKPAGTSEGGAGSDGASTDGAPAGDAAAASSAGTPVAGGAPGAQLIAVERFRPDPFKPYYTPVIQPPPAPPPPPRIPDPLDIPRPGGNGNGDGGLAPLSIVSARSFGGESSSGALVGLPPVGIPQYRPRTAPSVGPPPVVSSEGGGRNALRSPNKRVAGVIIGDSVRALIELSDGTQTITRVVQPGDEVEGIRILRIERVTENDTLVTRMTVLENGQERFFDLTP